MKTSHDILHMQIDVIPDPWSEFIYVWARIVQCKLGLRCRICQGWWTSQPGTIYCAGQHGACGICNKPRAGCKCLRTELI